jgi:hypothetical protein
MKRMPETALSFSQNVNKFVVSLQKIARTLMEMGV